MQMQSSLELAEKEHRKMFEKITERPEEMKKLMTEVQSSPQLAEEHRKMFEKIAEHAEEMKLMTEVQSSLQLAEKEHRKMFEKIAEHAEEMKLMTEVQLSSSRVCKVTLPEMAKSVARVIDGLRSRYNIPPTRV
ncbi:uncharacterized protein [Triticum aestivum]|uniref:uncharacterized protein isoform X5 n=1 Tax=Triticum aestivum TaxID=4565 RepID=UPI001D020522|nr:uncharacterized protein LOC123159652 isoform X5 [Triticum aestivum]